MYSNFKSIQLLIAALKQYEIKDIVLSPGGSDIPIIHSIETDPYFTCYSVVDERSAVYFGMGVSQSKNTPVACVCTSGTAVSNFLPGITEAYYQNVPIIAITSDKNPYFQGQIETQKIEQRNIFGECALKSVDLPLCKDETEEWYCERLIKESIVTALSGSKGPVQINIPIVGSYANYDVNELPQIRKVEKITTEKDESVWERYINKMIAAERILVFVGQNVVFSDEDKVYMEAFFSKFNCIFSVETISNLDCLGCVKTYPITEMGAYNDSLVPDLVISIGNNVSSYGMKPFLRKNHSAFEHFNIDASGRYRDVFQSLSTIFECTPSYFFKYVTTHVAKDQVSNNSYYANWKAIYDNLNIPEFGFSNIAVAQQLCKVIPENSILHTAILNSTRIFQFFPMKKGIRAFSNVGALGIDGCLSTFMGQAATTDNLAFHITGDLAFFYDMNAAGIRHLSNNVRIILINNGGGSEFCIFVDKIKIPTLHKYICAEHGNTAEGWVKSLGFEYYAVHDMDELMACVGKFGQPSEAPLFMEVFTDKDADADNLKQFYASNRITPSFMEKVMKKIKQYIRKI